MADLLSLKPGILSVKDRNFDYNLTDPLEISDQKGRTLLLICGDNGSGKTTLLEKIILPALKQNQAIYQFHSQDHNLQDITTSSLETIYDLIGRNLVRQILFNQQPTSKAKPKSLPSASILILDEADKLYSQPEFLELISMQQYKLVIMISHQLEKLSLHHLKSSFDQCCKLSIQKSPRTRNILKQLC